MTTLTTRFFEKPITEYIDPVMGRYAISFNAQPSVYPAFAMMTGEKGIFLSAIGSVAFSSKSDGENQIRHLSKIAPDQAGNASIIYVPKLLEDLFLEKLSHLLENFEKDLILYDKEGNPLSIVMPEYGNTSLMFLHDDKGLWFFCSSNYSCGNFNIEYLIADFSKRIKTQSYDPDKVIILTGEENTGENFYPWLSSYPEVIEHFRYLGWLS